MRRVRLAIVAGCAVLACTPGLAEDSKSAGPAGQVMKALEQAKLTYLAAKDPTEASRYVAAMRLGADQLFVVSAEYAQPALMNEHLLNHDYQWAYQELNSASKRDGRLFVQDLGTPGLRESRQKHEAFDVVYESAVHRTAFDGDWKAQQLTRDTYEATFDRVDASYAHALDSLVTTLSTNKAN
jgi:hypothetical protein